MSNIKLSDFRYTCVDPKQFDNALITSAFNMWYRTWVDSYCYFGWDAGQVRSDQWTRQDKVTILSYGEEPVGTMFFKYHDLDSPFIKLDSYFRMWKETDFEKVRRLTNSNRILVCSWFTLEKSWRKNKRNIDAKFILGGSCSRSFYEWDADIMLGTVVKESGMHTLMYSVGAQCITENVLEKNLAVDLIYWSKKEVPIPSAVKELNCLKESELIKTKPSLEAA